MVHVHISKKACADMIYNSTGTTRMHVDRILQSWRFCPLASLLVGMGYFEQAVVRINEVVFIAEEISRPFSLRYARCFAGAIYSGRYEPQVTIQYAEQAIALAQAQGFQHFQVMGTLLYGWALAVLGKQKGKNKTPATSP
jgi:hypothetical protein